MQGQLLYVFRKRRQRRTNTEKRITFIEKVFFVGQKALNRHKDIIHWDNLDYENYNYRKRKGQRQGCMQEPGGKCYGLDVRKI